MAQELGCFGLGNSSSSNCWAVAGGEGSLASPTAVGIPRSSRRDSLSQGHVSDAQVAARHPIRPGPRTAIRDKRPILIRIFRCVPCSLPPPFECRQIVYRCAARPAAWQARSSPRSTTPSPPARAMSRSRIAPPTAMSCRPQTSIGHGRCAVPPASIVSIAVRAPG